MKLIVDGEPNKVIAAKIGLSVRTIEVHRAKVFQKMNVRSLVELVKLSTLYEFANPDKENP